MGKGRAKAQKEERKAKTKEITTGAKKEDTRQASARSRRIISEGKV